MAQQTKYRALSHTHHRLGDRDRQEHSYSLQVSLGQQTQRYALAAVHKQPTDTRHLPGPQPEPCPESH